jgi:hypothetical protein
MVSDSENDFNKEMFFLLIKEANHISVGHELNFSVITIDDNIDNYTIVYQQEVVPSYSNIKHW